MIELIGNNITMTRGDTLKLHFAMEYVPESGDELKFGLKKRLTDEVCLIEKVIPNDTLILHLEPEDTKYLEFGNYIYDCQITFANGDVSTFIPKANFVLTEEVV